MRSDIIFSALLPVGHGDASFREESVKSISLAGVFLLAARQQPNPHSQPTHQQSTEQAGEKREQARQAAVHLNELAGNIHSEADARAFVDAVAEQFSGGQPQTWTTRSIRHRVARAEFHAVSDSAQLIPEQRI